MNLLFTWIVAAISASGYAGVLALMAIESACVPLPSEIIMPFAGYLVYEGRFSLVMAATAGALGCCLGSGLAWWVGIKGGRPLVQRWGRYVLLSQSELDMAERFFNRRGGLAVLIGRLLPIVRTFISLPAGIGRMGFWRFEIYTFIGSWPWCFGLAWLGFRLGKAWDSDPAVKAAFHRSDLAIAALLLAGIAWFVWSRRKAFSGG